MSGQNTIAIGFEKMKSGLDLGYEVFQGTLVLIALPMSQSLGH
jgi:hypothetical protein